jgi:hypothetical protein
MSGQPIDRPITYDRQLLLFGAKRDALLNLSEVHRYGVDSYGDEDYVSIYGMRPDDWYAAGVRLLGRTAVECTRDELAEAIAGDIAAVAASAPGDGALVIDPFAGSGNTLYWIVRRLRDARGLGFELDAPMFNITAQNLALVASPIDIVNVDHAAGLEAVAVPTNQTIVVFIAPPWGDALDPISGLDLRRTAPPIASIVDQVAAHFPHNPLLVAIQVFERLHAASFAELEPRFDWSALRIYDLNAAGQRHGVFLGSRGWVPHGATTP